MKNIVLKIGLSTDMATTLASLNTLEGLAKWWTNDVTGSPEQNGVIRFKFGEFGVDMKVLKNEKQLIQWQCIGGPEEWINTTLEFKLLPEPETTIFFKHMGWSEESEFMHHCSMKWAVFLLSLKQYLEKGQGQPFPNDVQITNVGN